MLSNSIGAYTKSDGKVRSVISILSKFQSFINQLKASGYSKSKLYTLKSTKCISSF